MAKRYGLVIDLDRCTGCQTCNVACKMEHNLDGFSGIRVDTVGGPHRDTPAGEYPNLSMYYLPVLCMHCSQPPCLPSCPTEAIYQRKDGIVLIDEEKCNGCQECLEACPYGVLVYDTQKNKAWKCNLCAHRVDEGLEPFCVLCCETEAMFFGDISDPSAQLSQLARKRKAYALQPESGAEPAVRYCPPRPRLR
ncbi:MAG: 4Fe-4S dicluster domain-containing protein [Chloroflexi bacterium]|nr:4Fe-4S dicluster domain-containing protein [Chloroflexota bacterium]